MGSDAMISKSYTMVISEPTNWFSEIDMKGWLNTKKEIFFKLDFNTHLSRHSHNQ